MAYDFSFKNNGFFVSHKGIITIDEISEANGLIHGHEYFDSHRYQIINLLQADFSEILQSRSKEPAATDWAASRYQSNVKVAIVAQEDKAVDFCKQYISESKQSGSPWDFKIFSDLEGALEWVGT